MILYFVSERAFDQGFVGFLIVFLGLFLTFFAMAFMEDQLSTARVHWPEGQVGRFWFWLGIVGGGLLVVSALAYAILPPDYRGGAGSRRVGIIPFMGQAGSEDGQPQAFVSRPGPDDQDQGAAVTQVGQTGGTLGALGGIGVLTTESFEGRQVAADPRDVVMHVRSKVTSYWRGRLFDDFDGQTWRRSNAIAVSRAIPEYKDFYWQAFFLEQDQQQSLFAGYNPVLVLPEAIREPGSLTAGATYSVLSQRPVLNSRTVRADRSRLSDHRYLALPEDSAQRLRNLAGEITEDASRPFEHLWLIVSHLRQNHSYDIAAENQLELSSSVIDFLDGGGSGSSLDFASATVLLARASGIAARLAVGYLPGKFDPFSGTHTVRRQDIHAWARVRFLRHGWVAFDGTPRPELDVFTTGRLRGFGGTAYIFQTRVGGGLYRVLQSGASDATREITDAFDKQTENAMPVAAIVAALGLGGLAYWLVRRWLRRTRAIPRYSRLSGDGRREILDIYKRMERLLRKRGLEPRRVSQTLGAYGEAAARHFENAVQDIEWIVQAAWSAAYDPAPPGADRARQAAERLIRLRSAMTRPQPS